MKIVCELKVPCVASINLSLNKGEMSQLHVVAINCLITLCLAEPICAIGCGVAALCGSSLSKTIPWGFRGFSLTAVSIKLLLNIKLVNAVLVTYPTPCGILTALSLCTCLAERICANGCGVAALCGQQHGIR